MVENQLNNFKRKSLEDSIPRQNTPKKQRIITSNEENNKAKKLIRLCCPAVSKIREIIGWEDEKIDIGSISSMFGIDPATLRLNGYFISRGADLIACSVTWNSLISYFCKKGLCTGVASSDAVIVDGKFSKAGTKRIHQPVDFIKQSQEGVGICGYSNREENQEIKENNNGRGMNERSCMSITHCGYEMRGSMKRLREDGSRYGWSSCKKEKMTGVLLPWFKLLQTDIPRVVLWHTNATCKRRTHVN